MGYHLNRLDEPVLMAVPKPMQTKFDIHHRLESCVKETLTNSVVGYRWNRLDEPVLVAVSKLLLTEFGIHHRFESCVIYLPILGIKLNIKILT